MHSLAQAIPGLGRLPVVGILRQCPPEHARGVAAAAASAGLAVIEVTLDSVDALAQIRAIADLGADLVVGVGTVTDPAEIGPAVDAGATFVVCPIVHPDIIDECRSREIPCLPGAATPTEIHRALELGATAVKVFPAHQLGGPGYLRAIAGPLRRPPLVPTGGVDVHNAAEFLDAVAAALGAGSALFPPDALAAGSAAEVEASVRAWVEAVGR